MSDQLTTGFHRFAGDADRMRLRLHFFHQNKLAERPKYRSQTSGSKANQAIANHGSKYVLFQDETSKQWTIQPSSDCCPQFRLERSGFKLRVDAQPLCDAIDCRHCRHRPRRNGTPSRVTQSKSAKGWSTKRSRQAQKSGNSRKTNAMTSADDGDEDEDEDGTSAASTWLYGSHLRRTYARKLPIGGLMRQCKYHLYNCCHCCTTKHATLDSKSSFLVDELTTETATEAAPTETTTTAKSARIATRRLLSVDGGEGSGRGNFCNCCCLANLRWLASPVNADGECAINCSHSKSSLRQERRQFGARIGRGEQEQVADLYLWWLLEASSEQRQIEYGSRNERQQQQEEEKQRRKVADGGRLEGESKSYNSSASSSSSCSLLSCDDMMSTSLGGDVSDKLKEDSRNSETKALDTQEGARIAAFREPADAELAGKLVLNALGARRRANKSTDKSDLFIEQLIQRYNCASGGAVAPAAAESGSAVAAIKRSGAGTATGAAGQLLFVILEKHNSDENLVSDSDWLLQKETKFQNQNHNLNADSNINKGDDDDDDESSDKMSNRATLQTNQSSTSNQQVDDDSTSGVVVQDDALRRRRRGLPRLSTMSVPASGSGSVSAASASAATNSDSLDKKPRQQQPPESEICLAVIAIDTLNRFVQLKPDLKSLIAVNLGANFCADAGLHQSFGFGCNCLRTNESPADKKTQLVDDESHYLGPPSSSATPSRLLFYQLEIDDEQQESGDTCAVERDLNRLARHLALEPSTLANDGFTSPINGGVFVKLQFDINLAKGFRRDCLNLYAKYKLLLIMPSGSNKWKLRRVWNNLKQDTTALAAHDSFDLNQQQQHYKLSRSCDSKRRGDEENHRQLTHLKLFSEKQPSSCEENGLFDSLSVAKNQAPSDKAKQIDCSGLLTSSGKQTDGLSPDDVGPHQICLLQGSTVTSSPDSRGYFHFSSIEQLVLEFVHSKSTFMRQNDANLVSSARSARRQTSRDQEEDDPTKDGNKGDARDEISTTAGGESQVPTSGAGDDKPSPMMRSETKPQPAVSADDDDLCEIVLLLELYSTDFYVDKLQGWSQLVVPVCLRNDSSKANLLVADRRKKLQPKRAKHPATTTRHNLDVIRPELSSLVDRLRYYLIGQLPPATPSVHDIFRSNDRYLLRTVQSGQIDVTFEIVRQFSDPQFDAALRDLLSLAKPSPVDGPHAGDPARSLERTPSGKVEPRTDYLATTTLNTTPTSGGGGRADPSHKERLHYQSTRDDDDDITSALSSHGRQQQGPLVEAHRAAATQMSTSQVVDAFQQAKDRFSKLDISFLTKIA